MTVGVLALQGDYLHHKALLERLDENVLLVKKPEHLKKCNGLIIPGGESTTLVKLMKNIGLFEEIPRFNEHWPVFGTCAGAILLSRTVANHPVESFAIMDMVIERNAYGRQIDSFIDDVVVNLDGKEETVEAVFIRAPKIKSVNTATVQVLSQHNDDIILVENDRAMAATFHPELTDDLQIHQYFLNKIRRQH